MACSNRMSLHTVLYWLRKKVHSTVLYPESRMVRAEQHHLETATLVDLIGAEMMQRIDASWNEESADTERGRQ